MLANSLAEGESEEREVRGWFLLATDFWLLASLAKRGRGQCGQAIKGVGGMSRHQAAEGRGKLRKAWGSG